MTLRAVGRVAGKRRASLSTHARVSRQSRSLRPLRAATEAWRCGSAFGGREPALRKSEDSGGRKLHRFIDDKSNGSMTLRVITLLILLSSCGQPIVGGDQHSRLPVVAGVRARYQLPHLVDFRVENRSSRPVLVTCGVEGLIDGSWTEVTNDVTALVRSKVARGIAIGPHAEATVQWNPWGARNSALSYAKAYRIRVEVHDPPGSAPGLSAQFTLELDGKP